MKYSYCRRAYRLTVGHALSQQSRRHRIAIVIKSYRKESLATQHTGTVPRNACKSALHYVLRKHICYEIVSVSTQL